VVSRCSSRTSTRARLPIRHETCQERPYDLVQLGDRTREVLAILEASRARFHVKQFREDFEYLDEFLAMRLPQTAHQWHGREAIRSTLAGWRPIYEQTAGIGDVQHDADGREYVTIQSRFFCAINRRFHAHDFWPEHAAAELRERWFSPEDVSESGLVVDARDPDRFVEVGGKWTQPFIERDVSSSQTQLLAAFLDLRSLEALAKRTDLKFKAWLARQLWALHERDNVLAGYAGPDDPRLVAFIKELWMRRNYGGKFGPTVHDLARDPETYGLGWNSNVFATGGVTRAEQFWLAFLATLPPEWAPAVETFLDACQYIGSHAHLKCGLVLTAPLDGARVQWNPIARAALMVPIGNHHLELRACGVLATTGKRERFVPTWWCVNRAELSNRVAPCLIHMLDAYFSALVLEYLAGRGVTEIIAVHDGWFIPASVEAGLYDDDGVPLSGAQVLSHAITHVGAEWLSGVGRIPDPDKPLRHFTTVSPDDTRPGLAVVYDWFADSLKGSPYETFACQVRDRWRRRVTDERWPRFTASGGEPVLEK